MGGRYQGSTREYLYAQFFPEFSHQRLMERLAGFDLATGELPLAYKLGWLGSLVDQDFAFGISDYTGNDLEG